MPTAQDKISEHELNKAVWNCRLICVDPMTNNNKFYEVYILNDGRYVVQNGRVGVTSNQQPAKHIGTVEEAIVFAEKQKKAKLTKKSTTPYREERTISKTSSVSNKGSLLSVVMNQIETHDNDDAKDLVKFLVNQNVHTITSNTTIVYNKSQGTFSTPRGLVEESGIVDARIILNNISKCVHQNKFNHSFSNLVADYCSIVPQNVGMKRDWDKLLFDNMEKIRKQMDILDSLEASLQQCTNTPLVKQDKIFNTAISCMNDVDKIRTIREYYMKGKGKHRDVSRYRLKTVWDIKINNVSKAFAAKGNTIGNIKLLWHGTSAANLLSILKGGLIIPPLNSEHVTGRMYGAGIYGSDMSDKALRYATGGWGGRTSHRVFMLLCNFAMGKINYPKTYTSQNPPRGYNSHFAKAGKSGVINNEMIVPNTYQVDLLHLCEFSQ